MYVRQIIAIAVLGTIGVAASISGRSLPVTESTPVISTEEQVHEPFPTYPDLRAKIGKRSNKLFEIASSEQPARVAELTNSLHLLHLISVRSFESMPMFGANRASFFGPSYSDLELPAEHLASRFMVKGNWRDARYIRVRDAGNEDARHGFEAWSWLYAMHRVTARGFVYRATELVMGHHSPGNGEARSKVTMIVGLPAETGSLDFDEGCLRLDVASKLEPSDRLWKLKLMQLVSILTHDPPVAYVKFFEARGHIRTRKLDEGELESLQRLRVGENHVITWNADCDQIQMVAAIRAKAECLKCHEGKKEGDLLGAFIYQFAESLPPGSKVRHNQQ